MKLASLKNNSRDGSLVVVSRDLSRAVDATLVAATLQAAIDSWDQLAPRLEELYVSLNSQKAPGAFAFDPKLAHSPLPRAFQWVDGSAYLNHVELVRRARGAEMPKEFLIDPLVYQGGSDAFVGPYDPILLESEDWGIDFESEVAVITDDVAMGVDPKRALDHVKLIMLVNDVSLRNLIPAELAKGFGFYQSKPASAFSPVAVTPDELGTSWQDGKVHLPLRTYWNDKLVGHPNAGQDMNFGFGHLLSHIAKTREIRAGSILGSGTISNRDTQTGYSCIQEIRMLEKIQMGESRTPFMRFGDRVRIEMLDANAKSIFGAIDQEVRRYLNPFKSS
jgi:fumarylacetoacetate (FAA) hydrolase